MITTKRLMYFIAGLVLVLGIFAFAPVSHVSAEDPDPGDPSGDGVEPIFIDGNPSCATLNADNTGFPNVTSNFGFKIGGSADGDYPLTSFYGELTGGALADEFNWVSILNSDGYSFDWLASLGIDAVIVKGGPNADAFVYVPEDTADTMLHPPVNPSTGEYYGISHIEFCYDYEFSAVKTANTSYTRTYSWTIDKSVDPDTHTGFAGDSFTSDYDIVVDQSYVDSDFAVSGTITVTNPSPFTAGFSVADSVGGTAASVSCPTYSLAPFTSTTCTYSAGLAAKADGTNTATITSLTAGIGGATATAGYTFGAPTTIVGYETVNVSDTFPYPGGTPEALGSASSDTTFDNDQDFECPTTAASYTNGYYTYTKVNRAQIVETGQYDETTVTVHCYLPQVTKTAVASYDETHTWTLDKTVNPLYQSGYPGDVLPWTWRIDVSETFAESNFAVSGDISVYNPHPTLQLVVDVADQLNDDPATTAAVDCDPVTEGNQTSLTVAALGTGACSYTAAPTGRTATLNTATATRNTVQFTGTAAVTFVKNVIHGTALITDTQIGLNQTLTAGAGPWFFTAPDSHTCSMDSSMYGADGYYEGQETNTAYLTPSGGTQQSDGALTEYMCEGGYVDLLKWTNGLVDPTMNWNFALYNGPDGFGSTALGTGTTFGDVDGVLDFGMPILNPEKTYTVCELGVPAGYSSMWQVGGSTVIPYNPDADKTPPEDLGNRCVDFGAGTTIPVTVRTTLHFQVDNRAPGGDPRTPGYWKNWNTCSGGRQALTAAANGGWENGFWLLDDVLNPAVGGGIVWDDILVDAKIVNINSCEYAVEILDQRKVTLNGIVGDGKKLASDPLRTLAMHLLAAQLNFGAGACTTPEVLDAALQAETLLDQKNFDGKTTITLTKAQKAQALNLAKYLDNYNNGMYCGSTIP